MKILIRDEKLVGNSRGVFKMSSRAYLHKKPVAAISLAIADTIGQGVFMPLQAFHTIIALQI